MLTDNYQLSHAEQELTRIAGAWTKAPISSVKAHKDTKDDDKNERNRRNLNRLCKTKRKSLSLSASLGHYSMYNTDSIFIL